MSEHFTKNTVEASCWCSKCGGPTPHRIDSGRRGPCLVCIEKLTNAPKPAAKEAERQTEMFEL